MRPPRRRLGGHGRVEGRVARHDERFHAGEMQPDLARFAFRIRVEPEIVRPFGVADRARGLGPRLRLADIVELNLVTRTAEWAGEDLHGRPSGGLVARVLDRLKDLEALELGVAEIKRLVGAGVTVGGAKMVG